MGIIPEITGMKFDVIHSFRFADDNLPPSMIASIRNKYATDDVNFLTEIRRQAKSLLKPGGVIVF